MPRIDWSFGPGRHPVAGAVLAGATALSLTMVAYLVGRHLVDIPAMWPLTAGAMLACAAAVSAAWQGMPGAAVAYRAVCWVGAGAWSSWTLTVPPGGPWSRWPLILLTTGTALAAVVGSGLAHLERRDEPEQETPKPKLRSREDRIAAEWQQRLQRITRREVEVAGVQMWDPPTGHTLHVQLPADGTTVGDVKQHEAQLAAAANLPPGCNVEVLASSTGRRECLIRIATENAMAETHHLPDSTLPLSIEGPLPVGIHADRTLASINLRYACAVLVGQTGSGKSNILNVITHQLVRCVDTLVWAIDLSGNGRYPRPWIRPWHEHRVETPAVDWAAVDAAEAQRLTSAAIEIINGRTAAYQQLMHEANDDKIPVSAGLPQIVILVDEFGTLPERVKDDLRTISDTGRGAGVRLVSCALAAKAQYISRDMIVQARERIAMRVTDEAELQFLFDAVWSRGRFDPASIPYEGSGLLSTGVAAPVPYKAWRLEPDRIAAAARAVAGIRPALDSVSAELAGGDYAGRWERTLPLMFPDPSRPAAPRKAAQAAGGTATLARPKEADVDLDESARKMQEAVERARKAREAAETEAAQPAEAAPDEADWTVVEGWLAEGRPDDAGPKVAPRVRVRQLVEQHRRDGIGPRVVWQQLQQEGYRTAEQTVITWMRADAAAGILAQPGGKGTPYKLGPRFTLEQDPPQ